MQPIRAVAGCTIHELWSLLDAAARLRDEAEGEKRAGGASASTSLSEPTKQLAWERLLHHARSGELCFVTARPPAPDYDRLSKEKTSVNAHAKNEKLTLETLSMKLDNPSLRCALPSLPHIPLRAFFFCF